MGHTLGLADSPLRERVIFVEGSGRSGTTFFTALLAAHPEIAGVTTESHLFDTGVDALFDNHEGGLGKPYLGGLISREKLVDLARDLVDGVLLQIRAETRPEARFVVEKTPAPPEGPEGVLARKRECYPDAWYLHILRDPDAVVRSLVNATNLKDRSPAAARRRRDESVAAVRESFGSLPHYREVSYEELSEEPVATMRGLFEWLGLSADQEIDRRLEALAKERFSTRGGQPTDVREAEPAAPGAPSARPSGDGVRRALGRARRISLGGLRRALKPGGARRAALGREFAAALRERDPAALERLSDASLEVWVRSADGDLSARGAEAQEALLATAEEALGTRFLHELWAVAAAPEFTAISFGGTRPDGTRVDLQINLLVKGGRVFKATILAAGGIGGREVHELEWRNGDGIGTRA